MALQSKANCNHVAALLVFTVTVALIPFINKHYVFGYDQALGTLCVTFLQLAIGALFLLLATALLTVVSISQGRSVAAASEQQPLLPGEQLHTQRHLQVQLHSRPIQPPKICSGDLWLAGALFGLKFGVMNIGMRMCSLSLHMLLQTTDVIWTVLAARFILLEHIPWQQTFCCAAIFVGCAVSAASGAPAQVGARAQSTPFAVAIAINLLSPLMEGLVVVLLRRAVSQQVPAPLQIQGDAPSTASACAPAPMPRAVQGRPGACNARGASALAQGNVATHITAYKLLVGALVVLPFALALEGPWHLSPAGLGGLAGISRVALGATLMIVFQLNWTWLSQLHCGTALGVIGATKVIPQWCLQYAASGRALSTWSGIGVALVLVASLAFAGLRRRPTGAIATAPPLEDAHHQGQRYS